MHEAILSGRIASSLSVPAAHLPRPARPRTEYKSAWRKVSSCARRPRGRCRWPTTADPSLPPSAGCAYTLTASLPAPCALVSLLTRSALSRFRRSDGFPAKTPAGDIMVRSRLRRQIALEAARLIYVDQESEYYRAKLQAARRLCQGLVTPADLPSTREIRNQLQAIRRSSSGDAGPGSHTSHRRTPPTPRRPRPARTSPGPARSFPHQPRANAAAEADSLDRFRVYHLLLAPLEDGQAKPEIPSRGGRASITACRSSSWHTASSTTTRNFSSPRCCTTSARRSSRAIRWPPAWMALSGHITPRTAWLIEHQPHAAALRDGSLGARSRRRLEANESFDDLMLLHDCDRRGRVCGVAVPELEDALESVRELARLCGDE